MEDRNCDINKESAENSIRNLQSIIDYLFELIKILNDIVSGKLLADMIREKLGKN